MSLSTDSDYLKELNEYFPIGVDKIILGYLRSPVWDITPQQVCNSAGCKYMQKFYTLNYQYDHIHGHIQHTCQNCNILYCESCDPIFCDESALNIAINMVCSLCNASKCSSICNNKISYTQNDFGRSDKYTYDPVCCEGCENYVCFSCQYCASCYFKNNTVNCKHTRVCNYDCSIHRKSI